MQLAEFGHLRQLLPKTVVLRDRLLVITNDEGSMLPLSFLSAACDAVA